MVKPGAPTKEKAKASMVKPGAPMEEKEKASMAEDPEQKAKPTMQDGQKEVTTGPWVAP